MASRMYKELCRIYHEVSEDHSGKSDNWHFQMTLDMYNELYPNQQADLSDLIDALEHASD